VLQLKQRHERAKKDELSRHRFITDNTEMQKAKIFGFDISRLLPRDGKGDKKQGKMAYVGSRAVGWAAQSMPPNIPFGNAHMMLMVGPIIIENGYPG
jgi:hypothetical protein